MREETKQIPRLLTVQDVSQALKISVGAVYQLIARRQIPHLKMGRRVRFDPKAIESWIEKQRVDVLAD